LRGGQGVLLTVDDAGLIVRPDVARRQFDAETPQPEPTAGGSATGDTGQTGTTTGAVSAGPAVAPLARRFHGTVSLDPTRVGRDAGRIAEEVIAHLAGQPGGEVDARLPNGPTSRLFVRSPRTAEGSSSRMMRSRSDGPADEQAARASAILRISEALR
jgi:hypothetical protein